MMEATSWTHQLMLAVQNTSSRCGGGAFVTFITGDGYARGALCLAKQLQVLASSCGLIVVHDDLVLPKKRVPTTRLGQLEHALGGAPWLVPLSSLVDSSLELNRMLNASGSWISVTHRKLWLFALPLPRVLIIDADVLLLHNMDSVFSLQLSPSKPIAAVRCGSGKFNSGVMLIQPSALVLSQMLGLARFFSYPWFGRLPYLRTKAQLSQDVPSRYLMPSWVRRAQPSPLQTYADICAPAYCVKPECLPALRMFPKTASESRAFRLCRERHNGTFARVNGVCESHLGDQTILNLYFGATNFDARTTSFVELPVGYNFNAVYQAHVYGMGGVAHREAQSIHKGNLPMVAHFAGLSKPWLAASKRKWLEARSSNLSAEWIARCDETVTSRELLLRKRSVERLELMVRRDKRSRPDQR